MSYLRRLAVAPLVVALIGCAVPSPIGAPELTASPDAATITVTKLIDANGESLGSQPRINEKGQVLLTMGSNRHAPVIWEDGEVTPVSSEDAPEGRTISASDFSNEGHVVGYYRDPAADPDGKRVTEPFIWHEGTWTRLPTPFGPWNTSLPYLFAGAADSVNDGGQILMRRARSGGSVGHTDVEALIWQDGKTTLAPPSGAVFADRPMPAVNGEGQVLLHDAIWQVGGGTTPTGAQSNYAINDNGQVVQRGGIFCNPFDPAVCLVRRTYLWEDGRTVDLGTLGGTSTEVLLSGRSSFSQARISNEGHVVGKSQTSSGEWHAFLWQNGRMTDLGTLGGSWSEATAVSNRGQVVGQSETASGEEHAFLWQNGQMIDLGALAGEGQSDALDVNDQGQIVGIADGDRVLWTAPPCEGEACQPDGGEGPGGPPTGGYDNCSLIRRLLGLC